jgi:hypothetical protein
VRALRLNLNGEASHVSRLLKIRKRVVRVTHYARLLLDAVGSRLGAEKSDGTTERTGR